jgi:lauroyl/myristoyl acyltransferase
MSTPTAPVSPADIARWMFWVPMRKAMHPGVPKRLKSAHGAWRMQWLAAGDRRELMADEYQRCFGDARKPEEYRQLVRDAYTVGWRTHLEELLIGKLNPTNIGDWIRFDGLDNLRSAQEQGKGVVWVYPHAGPVMMMIAGLAHGGFAYTQYAARGLAPDDVAKDHPELLGSNYFRAKVREVRERNEDAIPARYITLDTPVRELVRRLSKNEIVGLAFDGRIGQGWWPTEYLNRRALLSPGPFKLAVLSGAAVIPAFCHTEPDGIAVCEVGAAIEPGKDWVALAERVLRIESAWIRRYPEEYGIWLLHARMRNGIDDHPMFIDHAADERWRKWDPNAEGVSPNKGVG